MAGFGQDKTKKKASSKRQRQGISRQDLEAIAINHHRRGNLVEAEKGYREAIKAGHQNYAIIANLGVICKNSGRIDEAISLYKAAIKINPDESGTYLNLGNLYSDLGKFEDALMLCRRSLELKSNSAEAYLTQGWCQRNLGDFDQALNSTQKSLELKPDNPTAHMNLGSIYKDLGMLDDALASTQKSLGLKPKNPDAIKNLSMIYMDLGRLDHALASIQTYLKLNPDDPNGYTDLGVIYYKLGKLEHALTSTLKSLKLEPDDAIALTNLGSIYKDLGMLDHALASTHKSLKIDPNNADAHLNLGSIYKHLGKLDQALASTTKSLEIQPESAQGLCKLGQIKMALGQKEESKKDLINAIRHNTQECESYLALSMMIETKKDAEAIIEYTKSIETIDLKPLSKLFIEFALANCHHKLKNYDQASRHLQAANENKLIIYPSNSNAIKQAIEENCSYFNSREIAEADADQTNGRKRIFIVGMPRSGSTLLETTLSINQQVKDLGESRSLKKAISIIKQGGPERKNLDEIYSQLEPINNPEVRYTTDKNLYNYIYIDWIINHMPAAKVIHCHRNPMDNILSMYRSNLSAGNNYTSDLEDAAKILVAQNTIMETYRKNHPKQIFSFSYDKFVNQPKENLSELLAWLSLDFNENQLRPEASTRNINTASLIQSRNPISNKSVGGWKNYKDLLNPALKIIQKSGMPTQ